MAPILYAKCVETVLESGVESTPDGGLKHWWLA